MKKRFQYWFDNQMSKGTGAMIGMLALFTVSTVILVTAGSIILRVGEEGPLAAFWDSLAATVNAEMPYSGDGKAGYVVLTAISAVIGLLFTSVLIGIVNNAIEEKLVSLRKGNSVVLEKGHTVVLGFVPGEYELIAQLALAAEAERGCLVIAEDMERDEMEELIRENISVPKYVKIICRKVNICDPNALGVCSLAACKNIVVAPMEDERVFKTVLAVTSILGEVEKEKIRVVAAVSKDEFMLPANVAGKNGILMLQTHDMVARIIAHACTQPGLSEAFTDLFNFEGCELYLNQLSETVGRPFVQIMGQIDGGVPLGISHNEIITVNPNMDMVVEEGDSILLFSEHERAACWVDGMEALTILPADKVEGIPEGKVLVLGYNEVLDTILQELPESVRWVTVAGLSEIEIQEGQRYIERYPEKNLSLISENSLSTDKLERLVEGVQFVVLLSDHGKDSEQADLQSIQLLLKLRDIKTRLNLTYTVTAEMRREKNRSLVAAGDYTDFIVASNMTAMVLAQLVENPMLYGVFQELLSNVGNELYLKSPDAMDCEGEGTMREMRMKALSRGYLLLGYLKNDKGIQNIVLNPKLQEKVLLQKGDKLIVIGEK